MKGIDAIYEDGYYKRIGDDEYDLDFIETLEYQELFYKSLNHMRELDDHEILNSLQYFKDEDSWKAEIYRLGDFYYIEVDQSIFK